MKSVLVLALAVSLLAVPACKNNDKTGVAECDDYLEKAERCSQKGGPGEALKMSNDMLTKSWKKSAADSTLRATLPATCKAALEGAKKAYTACDW